MDRIIRILCIDDEVNVLRSLKRLFLDDDYVIFTATSIELALEVLKTSSPLHVVVCDYRMPGADGLEFLRQVCRTSPDTVRILISGDVDIPGLDTALADTLVYRFIAKPWLGEELKKCIEGAIELYFSRSDGPSSHTRKA